MKTLDYETFASMCEEAGIGSDNKEEMEQDYFRGMALADLVTVMEEGLGGPALAPEAYEVIQDLAEELEEAVTLPEALEVQREKALAIAALAVRFAAEVCRENVS